MPHHFGRSIIRDIFIFYNQNLLNVEVPKLWSPFLISSSSIDVSYATYRLIPYDTWHSFQAVWLHHSCYFQVTHVNLFL
jgi:hypothetical protein